MTLKETSYIPHKIRSHPLRCLILPIFATLLFISYWFILCPLVYVGLCNMQLGWTSNWHFYYWITSLLIFLIILAMLVFLWRKKCKFCPSEQNQIRDIAGEDCKLIGNGAKEDVLKNNESQSKCVKELEDRLDGDLDKINNTDDRNTGEDTKLKMSVVKETEHLDQVDVKIDQHMDQNGVCVKEKTTKERPDNLTISTTKSTDLPQKLSTTEETHVEFHSPACPLTPREIFFWDLIQSANQNGSVNFIENDKQNSLGVGTPPISAAPAVRHDRPYIRYHSATGLRSHSTDRQFFVANVPQRRSLTTEVYMYIDGGEDEKYLRIRMDDKNVNCV